MINGIRIEDETKIVDNRAMANGNKPIDFAFIEARDGLKDSPNWSHHKSSLKELVGKSGVILVSPYTKLAYSPASPTGSQQVRDLFSLANAGGAYLFHLPLSIMLINQDYTPGNYYPVVDKTGYIGRAVDAITTAKSLIGRNPILITTPGFIGALGTLPKEIIDCPLYVAHWNSSFPMLASWEKYTFWESAKLDSWVGVDGPVFNIEFPDTRTAMKNWINSELAPIAGGYKPGDEPPPPPPPDTTCPDGQHWDATVGGCVADELPPQIPGNVAETLQAIYTDVHQIKLMIDAFRSVLNVK